MQPVSIQLRERITLLRGGEPMRFGVPLAKGTVLDPLRLQLSSVDGSPLPAQFRRLSQWPDGSVRWACVETILPSDPSQPPLASVRLSEAEPAPLPTAEILTENNQLQVRYEPFSLTVDSDATRWYWKGLGNQAFSSQLITDDAQDKPCTAHLDESWQVTSTGPVATSLTASGWWHDHQGEKLAKFRCELTFHANGLVTADAMIHNPKRARHPGGLWDLGDPGSIHFGGMRIETITPRSDQFRLAVSADDNPKTYSTEQALSLHQESSGGENWNSRNHINAEGVVLPRYRGYRLQYGTEEPEAGLRASPVLEATASGASLSISLPHFWQNFPSAIDADESTIRAWLFPANKPEPYELQGGERKTQRIVLGYGQRLEQLTWSHSPVIPVIPPEHYETTDAFPWFRANQPKTTLDKLIQEGLEGPSNFFAKREVIDEYGWRNFGDIFADHETLYQKEGEEPYISHYNNQYDAIYGFARQFALTGDARWFELMDDLARHVVDIDIYHTSEDRAEYNHGLFWHTDHYLDAHTATHRTFSCHNDTSSTPGQTGGGPGAEHCYSTGHLYHYWMTGNQESKEVVLELAHWMGNVHGGEKGLLAEVLTLKKQELPKLKALLRGEHVTSHCYPFTRATGNYINTLLDAHLIEPNRRWLMQVELIIRQSFHPADEIDKRNLLNVETGWSYLILLTSIARYLQIKEGSGKRDESWQYARDSFLNYTGWMLIHERPFLADTKELEFANDTWTAQDIRKAMLMFRAAQEDPQSAETYQAKGAEWLQYVTENLMRSPERNLARLLIILLQNYGPQHGNDKIQSSIVQPNSTGDQTIAYPPPVLGWARLMGQIATRLLNGLRHFRPSREKAWLEARLDRQ